MPAIQEVVSAMVCGHEQAASTTNGAARVHEGKHHRGHGPLLPQVAAISAGTGGWWCDPWPRISRKRSIFL